MSGATNRSQLDRAMGALAGAIAALARNNYREQEGKAWAAFHAVEEAIERSRCAGGSVRVTLETRMCFQTDTFRCPVVGCPGHRMVVDSSGGSA